MRTTIRSVRVLLTGMLLGSASVASGQTAYWGSGAGVSGPAAVKRQEFKDALTSSATNDLNAVADGALSSFGFTGFGTTTPSSSNEDGLGLAYVAGKIGGLATDKTIQGNGRQTVTFTFSQFINGFGADWFGIGIQDIAAGGVSYTLFADGVQVGTPITQSWGGSSTISPITFFGATSNTRFNKVEAYLTLTGDFYEMDNITVGRIDRTNTTVPEPSTYALMAAGLLGIVAVNRRRQRA